MGTKGDWRRPCSIGKEELDLRNLLAYGKITFREFEIKYKRLLKAGKITRSGQIIRRKNEDGFRGNEISNN